MNVLAVPGKLLGNVNELDNMLQVMWDNYRCGPTVILANSQEVKNITNKVLSNASGPLPEDIALTL